MIDNRVRFKTQNTYAATCVPSGHSSDAHTIALSNWQPVPCAALDLLRECVNSPLSSSQREKENVQTGKIMERERERERDLSTIFHNG